MVLERNHPLKFALSQICHVKGIINSFETNFCKNSQFIYFESNFLLEVLCSNTLKQLFWLSTKQGTTALEK